MSHARLGWLVLGALWIGCGQGSPLVVVVLIVIALWAYLYDVKGLCSRRPVLSALAHKLSNVRIWTRRHDPDAFANEGSHAV